MSSRKFEKQMRRLMRAEARQLVRDADRRIRRRRQVVVALAGILLTGLAVVCAAVAAGAR